VNDTIVEIIMTQIRYRFEQARPDLAKVSQQFITDIHILTGTLQLVCIALPWLWKSSVLVCDRSAGLVEHLSEFDGSMDALPAQSREGAPRRYKSRDVGTRQVGSKLNKEQALLVWNEVKKYAKRYDLLNAKLRYIFVPVCFQLHWSAVLIENPFICGEKFPVRAYRLNSIPGTHSSVHVPLQYALAAAAAQMSADYVNDSVPKTAPNRASAKNFYDEHQPVYGEYALIGRRAA
jgi:hypothetical protein